jgi:periplasmic divalent cation tolerance protein
MDRAVVVYTTAPALVEGERIAAALVVEGLAACVNILPGIVSHYRWKGAVARADEVVLLVKTRASRTGDVEARIRALHPYETPVLLVLAPERTDEATLAWIFTEVEAG